MVEIAGKQTMIFIGFTHIPDFTGIAHIQAFLVKSGGTLWVQSGTQAKIIKFTGKTFAVMACSTKYSIIQYSL